MKIDDCYQLGYVVKSYGLKGGLHAILDVDNPLEYSKLESVLLEFQGKLIPFFIQEISISHNKARIQFEDIKTSEDAKELIGCNMFLPLDQLPDLEDGQFYYHDLIGFQVLEKEKTLGVIEAVYQPSTQYIASINIDGHEVFFPLEDAIVQSVDLEKKVIVVDLPEGLIDIYTSPDQ